MAIKNYKATTNGRRGMSTLVRSEITTSTPEKSLVVSKVKTGGRNNQGRTTVRHIGGGAKQKYRIIAINLFHKGVKPAWEDEKNKKGKIFILEYEIKSDLNNFLIKAQEMWIKMMCYLIGEQMPYTSDINGIRFVDKTVFGKKYVLVLWSEKWGKSIIF